MERREDTDDPLHAQIKARVRRVDDLRRVDIEHGDVDHMLRDGLHDGEQ